jgi:hypothetical protein
MAENIEIGSAIGGFHFGAAMSSLDYPPPSGIGDPLWPFQGPWSEDEYLSLQNRTNRLVELSDGRIEVLPMPKPLHQRIVLYIYLAAVFTRCYDTGPYICRCALR